MFHIDERIVNLCQMISPFQIAVSVQVLNDNPR